MSVRTVTVAVTTYHRLADLDVLLPMLIDQIEDAPDGYEVNLLVVDNDPHAGAADIVAGHSHPKLRYVVETHAGIAAGRNRALAEAEGSDLLAFIDDDERPSARWLTELLTVGVRTGATAVAGPVVTRYDRNAVDPWIVESGFLDRRHRAGMVTGTELRNAATNNLLLDLRAVRRFGVRFDVEFGLSGGEDTLFTRSLVAAGGRIVWCQEAVVTEERRPERLTRRWMLALAFSYGSTDARVAVVLASGTARRVLARADALFWGGVRVGVGSVIALLGRCTRSLARRAYGEQMVFRGCGLVLGAFGFRHERYRRTGAGPAA